MLFLNPGLAVNDHYVEQSMPAFRLRLMATLRQDFAGIEFPFLGLDPRLSFWGGYIYWEKKLAATLRVIADRHSGRRYLDALRSLSQRLAVVQLIPYHSRTGGFPKPELLPSAQAAQRFARDVLIPSAHRGTKTIIVLRQKKAGISNRPRTLWSTLAPYAGRTPGAGNARRQGDPRALREIAMKPDPAAHVVDEVVDPGTRRVLLKFDDGTFEATRWPASRFRLPGYVGSRGPRSVRCHGPRRPIQ
jgi:hypothetical protein